MTNDENDDAIEYELFEQIQSIHVDVQNLKIDNELMQQIESKFDLLYQYVESLFK